MTIEITFLGTGTSQGIPMIGCDCQVCRADGTAWPSAYPSFVEARAAAYNFWSWQ